MNEIFKDKMVIGALVGIVACIAVFSLCMGGIAGKYYGDMKKEADFIIKAHPNLKPEYDMYMADGKIDSDEISSLKKSAIKELKK